MLKSYLKASVRNLLKDGFNSFVNLLGVSVAFATVLIIIIYTSNEMSIDNLSDKDRIYRIEFYQTSTNTPKWPIVPPQWVANYVPQMDALESVLGMTSSTGLKKVRVGDREYLESRTIRASSEVIEMFDLELAESLTDPLKGDKKIVLSEALSMKYFPNGNGVGEFINVDGEEYMVSGIFRADTRLHMDFDWIESFDPLLSETGWHHAYIRVKPGTDVSSLAEVMNELTIELEKNLFFSDADIRLIPLEDIYFEANAAYQIMNYGSKSSIYIFWGIGFLVVVIAAINFINLSAASLLKRTKEVSMRKVLGASKSQVMIRLLIESGLIILLAYVLGILFTNLSLPLVNQVFGMELSLSNIPGDYFLWASLILLVVGLVSISIPALVLTKMGVLGGLKSKKGKGLKNAFIVFQFAISTFLIVGALAVRGQLDFVKSKDLGYGEEKVLFIMGLDPSIRGQISEHRKRFETHPNVISTAATMGAPGHPRFIGKQNTWFEGMAPDESITLTFYAGDEPTIETLGLEIIEGRSFKGGVSLGPELFPAIVNETAVKQMGWEDPIGKQMRISNTECRVVGVVKDFHFAQLKAPIRPTAILLEYSKYLVAIRMKNENIQETLRFVEDEWAKIAPDIPFDAFFLDDNVNSQYAEEERMQSLLDAFTVIALLISAIGTLGMMILLIEEKIKEIGIRKVLGASFNQILLSINKKALIMLLVANLVAIPFAFIAVNNWLDSFAYRMTLNIGIFLIAIFVTTTIAMISLGYHSIRAAKKNPVDTLRYE